MIFLVSCGIGLTIALPMSIALFPQHSKVKASKLEPEFQNILGADGKIIEYYTYDKGL